MKRKPRLPDRLLEEVAEHSDALGKRQKLGRTDRGSGNTKKNVSSRKALRSAVRQEKKRKKQENRALYLQKRFGQKKTKIKSASPKQPNALTEDHNSGVENSKRKQTRENVKRHQNKAAKFQSEQRDEEMTVDGMKQQKIAQEIEEEKRGIRQLEKRLGMAVEATEEDLNLDGLLDGFDDETNVTGMPQMESHSDSDHGESLKRDDVASKKSISEEERSLDSSHSDLADTISDDSEGDRHKGSGQENSSSLSRSHSDEPPPLEPAAVYVPPALRKQMVPHSASITSRKQTIDRRVRGLINRLSEENIKGIANELVKMHSELSRFLVSAAISSEITRALAEGPRATAQFIGIASALISAVCTLANSHEISATFLSSCARQLESCYEKDDSLGAYNTLGIFSHLYLCGLITAQILFGLLHHLTSRFQELDIGMLYRLLETCGLKLRSDDPEAMKEFVIAVHNKAAELSSQGDLSHKAELMLDLVIDVKNNKLSKTGKRESFCNLSPGIGKWLKRIEVSKMALLHLTWDQIKTPNLKGPWWLPDPQKQASRNPAQNLSAGNLVPGAVEDELLSLASRQRMNTEVRKAVFCVIMGAQDVLDACEKLLRMPLKGEQDREIIRVLLDCCLQEKRWNPFYSAVANRLCRSKKSHSITLKFCLLNKLKVLDEMDVRSLDHIAKLLASALHADVLPLGMLKGVDLSPSLSTKALFFWRIFFVQFLLLFTTCKALTESLVRLSHSEELLAFSKRLLVFVQCHFADWIADHQNLQKIQCVSSQTTLLERCNTLQSTIRQMSMN